MMAAQEVKRGLLVASEELGGNGGNGHDLGGRELCLRVIFVSERFEQFVEEAVQGYNLVRHGRLREEMGFSNLTLPIACMAYTR